MRNVFEFLVQTGMDQLELIGDAEKKATICASLAQAIAQSGLLSNEGANETEETVEEAPKTETKKSSKKNSKKDALKLEASKTAAPAPIEEEVPETPQEPEDAPFEPTAEAEETEFVDEWTEGMCEAKAEQLGLLETYCEAWGEDYVYADCLGAFTEGSFSGAENVRPSNIDGFVVYLQELAIQFAGE